MKLVVSTILLILAVMVACADPIPPGDLVWSGTYTYTWCGDLPPVGNGCTSFPPGFTLTYSGISSIENGYGGSFGLLQGYTVDTSFTVTAAGDFLLSSSGTYLDEGSTCSDVECITPGPAYPDLAGNFSASIGISGPDAFTQSLSASGSALYGTGSSCLGADCFATVSISDDESDVVNLATGSYTLAVTYFGRNDSLGNNDAYTSVSTELVPTAEPTPEPGQFWFLIIGMVVIFVAKARLVRIQDQVSLRPSRPPGAGTAQRIR